MAKKKRTAATPAPVPVANSAAPKPATPAAPGAGPSIVDRFKQIFGADLRSLALLRIGLGLLIIADLIDRARDLRAHYTDFGMLARGPLLTKFMNDLAVCIHTATGTAVGAAITFTLQGFVALLLVIGWRTRIVAPLSWFLLYSLHLRNPVVLQGGDDLLRMMLFWGMFLPLGARYSVDAALKDASVGPAPEAPTHTFSAATVALLGQILVMYWCTSILKSGVEWHAEGSAVYYALHFDQLALRPGLWLGQFYPLTVLLTHLTMFWEGCGPFLLISPLWFGPLRTFAAVAFMGMHHCFALCLMLGLFPWIDTVSMLMLLPAWFWDKASRLIPLARQRQAVIYFDGECDVCKKLVFILREFLLVRAVAVQPAQNNPDVLKLMESARSWVVVDPQGSHTEFAAFCALCDVSPLLGWCSGFLRRPFVAKRGQRLYRAIADRRARLARFSAAWLPWCNRDWTLHWVTSGVVFGLFAMIVAWNTAALPGSLVRFPEDLRPLAYFLRLDQDWGMFAPFPQKEDGWYVVNGHLQDQTVVDVYRHSLTPSSYDKPEVVSDMYSNQRWSKYMMNIWLARNADYRLYFGQYLCRMWNGVSSVRTPRSLVDFEITYMKEMTLADYKVTPPEKVVIWKHYCYEVPKT